MDKKDYRVEVFGKLIEALKYKKITEKSLLKDLGYHPKIQANLDYISLQNLRQEVMDVSDRLKDAVSLASYYRDLYKYRFDEAKSLIIKQIKDEVGATQADKIALSTEIELSGVTISCSKERMISLAYGYWYDRFSSQAKQLERAIVNIKDDMMITKERIAKGLD